MRLILSAGQVLFVFCLGSREDSDLALSVQKLLQRQYYTLHVTQRQSHMLHVRKTISPYNTRHTSLSSRCPVLLINFFQWLRKCPESLDTFWRALGEILECTNLQGLWRLNGIQKGKIKRKVHFVCHGECNCKGPGKTVWNKCEKKQ